MNRLFARPLYILATAYVALGLIYAWATPPFEASDEYWHFGMLEYIHVNHALPIQNPDAPDTLWKQEGSQPPLYYAVAAALIAPFDLSGIDDYRVLNPHVRAGQPDSDQNKNLVLHDGTGRFSDEAIVAIYVVRVFGIGLGLVTVLAVYAITRLVAPQKQYWPFLAAGMLAFNPMFVFIFASINNDTLVTALSSLVVYLMLLTLRHGFDFRRSLWLAILVALATLTKLSALVLLPVIALLALWTARQKRDWRGLFILGALVVCSWIVLAGWWYLRNIQLYDELFGTSMMATIAGERPDPFTLRVALDEFEGFRWAFWGVFGVFNLIVPFRLFYVLLDVIVLSAGVGILLRFRRDDRSPLVFLGLIVIIGFVAFLAWTSRTYASQGRLLFPYVGAIMPLMAVGLGTFWQQLGGLFRSVLPGLKAPSWLVIWPVPLLGLAALLIPFLLLAPTYRVLSPIDDPLLPQDAIPVYARFGDVELVSYEFEDKRYGPGDDVPITLYWHVAAQSERDNSLYLSFLSPEGAEIGKVDSFPGGGRLRTSTWEAGQIYADTYAIPLAAEATGQYRLRLQVGWWHYPTKTGIAPHDDAGQPLDSVMLDAGAFVLDDNELAISEFVLIDPVPFGGVIRLVGYTFDPEHTDLRLGWEATATMEEDYTVFAQVLNANNDIVGQGDAPPMLPTQYWPPGERFLTRHILTYPETVPAGDYRLIVGWYRASDFTRLETNHPDNAYTVLEFTR